MVFSLLAPVFFFNAGAMLKITKINFYGVGLFIGFTALYGFEKEIITIEMFNTILLCILFSSLIAAYFEKR